jgi:hypothetical protein
MSIPSIADADFSIWRSEGDLLPCRVGADSREESRGERDGHRRAELRKGIAGATAAATPCLAGGIAGAAGAAAGKRMRQGRVREGRGMRQGRWMRVGRSGCGRTCTTVGYERLQYILN